MLPPCRNVLQEVVAQVNNFVKFFVSKWGNGFNATRVPDYAHPLTLSSTTWTATENCYVNYNIMGDIPLKLDGVVVSCTDNTGPAYNTKFAGYINKGSILECQYLTLQAYIKIWPLLQRNGYNDTEVYSTNEVKTNKVWIDGKPIYRKCFTGLSVSFPSGTPTGFINVVATSSIPNINKITSAMLYSGDIAIQPPECRVLNGYVSCDMVNGGSRTVDSAIFEYTKTTD